MASERDDFSMDNELGLLSVRHYDIAGNEIRAFFDGDEKLVFVIDDTVAADKPNVMLVIDRVDGRKWDDVLANDYGVSLEAVRPKKNNKYQKLDIEYGGLGEYERLIRDFDDGNDLKDDLAALAVFRTNAARRAAAERLQTADTVAENARETILRAEELINGLQVRIKTLRAKLAQQKKAVGREPTKQSAAKILRTESQIDALKDKQQRARRRLDNARRRLAAAEDDAEVARGVLKQTPAPLPAAVANTQPAIIAQPEVPATIPDDNAEQDLNDISETVKMPHFDDVVFEDYKDDDNSLPEPLPVPQQAPRTMTQEQLEPKAEEMAEEVKPLFDKDPEILDEEIAFKPIEFTVDQTAAAVSQNTRLNEYEEPAAPLSFTPPTGVQGSGNYAGEAGTPRAEYSPVLDTITAAQAPINPVSPAAQITPIPNDIARPAPISPVVPGGTPAVSPRPVSPISGTPATPVGGNSANTRKPNVLYYVLLVALIALSIFTLWLYQQKNGDKVPDLVDTNKPKVEETAPQPDLDETGPFIEVQQATTVEEVSEPEPAPEPTEPVVADEPQEPVVNEPEPTVAEPEPEPMPEPQDTQVAPEPEPQPEPEPEPAAPVVVNKPAYNAGAQNEKMFVAADNYDTDVAEPVVAYEETTTVQQYETNNSGQMCDDGTAPDGNGCCSGEVYTDLGDNGYACCSQATGDCFPPLL